jgi:hypothetical protein
MQSWPVQPRRSAVTALTVAIAIACCTVASTTAHAQRASAGAEYNPFARNRVQLSIGGGVAADSHQTYLQFGVGIGYFLTNGLQIGVATDLWTIGDPTLINVTPGLTYVFWMVPKIKPYIGGFYRHAFVFDRPDLDSIGSRAGLYFVADRVYFGLGVVYEHWLSCPGYLACDEVYPEAVLAFSF